ncbi:MAG: hypothetical protein KJN76_09520 [Eudoraea sp.]|nr:hypothetical protein [Eudoraea sp.]
MKGSKVTTWLEVLKTGGQKEKNEVADHLLGISEWYFDDKKISSEKRLEIINDLIKLENNPDPIVRKCIVYLVGLLKTPAESINKFLAKMLMDENEGVQITAVWSSGNLGEGSAPLIPILSSLSKHPNREVRWRIPWALKEIAHIDNSLSKVLMDLSGDSDRTTRMYALDAIPYCIEEIDSKIERVVRSALKSKDESSAAACRVIQKTRHDWKGSKRRLMRLVKNDESDAVLALCMQWPEMVHEPLVNNWLKENSGYWWAKDLLEGKSITM